MNFGGIVLIALALFLLSGPGGRAEDPAETDKGFSSFASVAAPLAEQAPGKWFDGWYRGASGYDKAVEEYKQTGRPMVVYMTVGWCPYCRRFEKDVLSSPLVRDFMQNMSKVIIDPESGQRENDIAFQYGIRGFPSFFLHPPQPARAVQLYTGVSPTQFIGLFQEALQ